MCVYDTDPHDRVWLQQRSPWANQRRPDEEHHDFHSDIHSDLLQLEIDWAARGGVT